MFFFLLFFFFFGVVIHLAFSKAQLSNEMGVGFLTIAKSVSYECNFFRIYDYI